MKIKVLRDYCGEEGTDVDKNVYAGEEFTVSRDRGNSLKVVGLVEILEDEADQDELRADGPTIEEFLAAGYPAKNYPPIGYASRSTDEEIAAAVAAQTPIAPISSAPPAPEPDESDQDGEKDAPEHPNKAAPAPRRKARA